MKRLTALLFFCFITPGAAVQRSLPDQVIINTQRLSDIERRINFIETRLGIIIESNSEHISKDEILGAALAKEIAEIKSVLFGIGTFTVTNLIGLVLFLLKDKFFGKPRR